MAETNDVQAESVVEEVAELPAQPEDEVNELIREALDRREKGRRKKMWYRLALYGMLLLGMLAYPTAMVLTAKDHGVALGGDCYARECGTVKTYYRGVAFQLNSYPIAVNFGLKSQQKEYVADVDGDGVTELVCQSGKTSFHEGDVRVYKKQYGSYFVGRIRLDELGIVEPGTDISGIRMVYLPETNQIRLIGAPLEGEKIVEMSAMQYDFWLEMN